MSMRPLIANDDHDLRVARGLRTLALLGVACLLFAAVVYMIVSPPAEPPVAAQSGDADATLATPAPGT